MNDENQDSIRDIIVAALNKIYEVHGVGIGTINADWIDVGIDGERKKILTFLEIEAEL